MAVSRNDRNLSSCLQETEDALCSLCVLFRPNVYHGTDGVFISVNLHKIQCSRTRLIRINLDVEPIGYAENPENWIFFMKATLKVSNLTVVIYICNERGGWFVTHRCHYFVVLLGDSASISILAFSQTHYDIQISNCS